MINATSFQNESYDQCIEELSRFLLGHGAEVEIIPINPAFDLYEDADRRGGLNIYTMRHNGELVGYSAFWIGEHPHHVGKIWATNDLVYIRPDHRGEMAMKFFEYCNRCLEDADVISYSLKVEHDHPELMEHLGMTCTEKVYTKVNK